MGIENSANKPKDETQKDDSNKKQSAINHASDIVKGKVHSTLNPKKK